MIYLPLKQVLQKEECIYLNLHCPKPKNEVKSLAYDSSESYSLIESDIPVLAAEIMIMIAEPWARRKGYATEAVHAMMHFGIQIRGIRRFVAKIDDSNQASIGLFTQLGFRVAKKMPYFSEIHMALDITADIETRLQSSVEQMKH